MTASRRTAITRARLACGVSLAALVSGVAAGPASAQTLGALMAATHQATAAAASAALAPPIAPSPTAAGMAGATARALRNQTQLNSALDLAQQAQAAARAAAAALNPNVPNGLVLGGLQPVAKPVPAASDPTGLNTWEGADAPTASASNPDQVTVVQTASRAILSWQTFNVGKDTTLTFQQQQNGVVQPNWIALNRVVGQLNPTTGLRDPSLAPAPSQILGAIKADGEVLVINQNGVLFGPTAQINTQALVASSLEIGHALEQVGATLQPIDIAQRNAEFLNFGLLGYAEQAQTGNNNVYSLSSQALSSTVSDPMLEGSVQVAAGAQINTASGGFVILAAPKVVNAGAITSPEGQVTLTSGRDITFTASEGDSGSVDPDLRGLLVTSANFTAAAGNSVQNTGILSADQGYVSLVASQAGAVLDSGLLTATTSVSRNGYIDLSGGSIQVAANAVIAITPDASDATIPQDLNSLSDFKPSRIRIGDTGALIDIGSNSLIYAPGANISIGADPGAGIGENALDPNATRVFVDSGATISAAGLPNVMIPISQNSIEISPVKGNELADSPAFRNGFLNGATVFIDPRLSGVTADGVAWIGSPLISAQSYAQQVGVTASELMTKGGAITLGVAALPPAAASTTTTTGKVAQAPDVVVKSGAVLDISGGWKTYQGGVVQQSQLVDANGEVIPISQANPDDVYVAVYNGFTTSQPRWGVVQTYVDPLLDGSRTEGTYTEGADAGSLTLKGSSIVLDGTVYAAAYAGPEQTLDAQVGTAAGSVYGDVRSLQAVSSQLPMGGYLNIQALGLDSNNNELGGGGDIDIVPAGLYAPVSRKLRYGQGVHFDRHGNAIVPPRPRGSDLRPARMDTISLDADALSATGLGELNLETSGAITLEAGAKVTLSPGGAFEAAAGRSITVNGVVSVPSGSIDLTTAPFGGSTFVAQPEAGGSFDITVRGQLDAAGRFVNDYGAAAGALVGDAYQDGGEVTLAAASHVDLGGAPTNPFNPSAPTESTDVSGSIRIDKGSLIDVSGGSYVDPQGNVSTTAKGGSVTLAADDTYAQLTNAAAPQEGGVPGFRVGGIVVDGALVIPVNPSAITSVVDIASGAIRAQGFDGGGTFTLDASSFGFGTGANELPLDFFSTAGFSSYRISVYETDLVKNAFDDGYGGYNAVLATDVATVGKGQTLSLNESIFSPILSNAQIGALRALSTGGALSSVLTAGVPTDAWDQRAVSLTLGGLTELHVARGGLVTGAPGASLTVGELFDQGTIRIVGGSVNQSLELPTLYASASAVGVHRLADVFSSSHGVIDPDAPNALGLTNDFGQLLTNQQVAVEDPIYLLGDLAAGQGVRLSKTSVVDLSGAAIVDPRAQPIGNAPPGRFVDGEVVGGGALTSVAADASGGAIFATAFGGGFYQNLGVTGSVVGETLTAAAGSQINLSGAQATFDRPAPSALPIQANPTSPGYAPTLIWSDAGALALESGGTIAGAEIDAKGGASLAQGGTLTVLDPVIYEKDPAKPTLDAIGARDIARDGFTSFVALGGLTSHGNATLSLAQSVFVESPPIGDLAGLSSASFRDANSPTLESGGKLTIDAAYIALDGSFQSVSTPAYGKRGDHSLVLNADNVDITGAVIFGRSIGDAKINAKDGVRLIGVEPWQQVFDVDPASVNSSLAGQLAANGNVTIKAAVVYPTTGTSFQITSAAAKGRIAFQTSRGPAAATPYSAGGNLLVQADHIVQGGDLQVPLGTLTLGSDAALKPTNSEGTTSLFAPATQSVVLTAGSTTAVSANGLSIPYGTTTDQIEYYFTPTSANPLSAPPAALLDLAGANITVDKGATVNLKGGGDVYGYEFVSGVGGTRDVLDRYNSDPFSSNNGYQYPDGRQVYAIVPGLSNAAVAAYDPIYSTNYSALYSPSQVGLRVYFNAAPGLAAGWYTLLPAQYALLPGGMRVVQDTGAPIPPPVGGQVLSDGTIVTSGRFGLAGANTEQATLDVFDVQSQAVFRQSSDIALTSGDTAFAADAAHNGVQVPQLPIDAGRLVLNPLSSLTLDAAIQTTPAAGGRGSEVDIAGEDITIAPDAGTNAAAVAQASGIVLTASSLANLDAASLFIGGTRTDNANGTTSLDVTTNAITVDAGAVLSAPEIILATDGKNAKLTVDTGASITATGAVTDTATGDYLIDGQTTDASGAVTQVQSAQGGFLRVSNGPLRLVTRSGESTKVTPGALTLDGAHLQGASVELESSGELYVAQSAKIDAASLALAADQIRFARRDTHGHGLVITPTLLALIGKAGALTLQSPDAIGFTGGVYSFGNLTLDTPGVADLGAGDVTLKTGALQLSNSSPTGLACGAKGAPGCGGAGLTFQASTIAFQSGTLQTYGFGRSVTLSASGGVFDDGVASLDVGAAALTLDTPFLGDRATADDAAPLTSATAPAVSFGAVLPSLVLATTGAVSIVNPTPGAAFTAPAGTPGASLTLDGRSVSIDGAEVRATAGALTVKAARGITLTDGATLATPGYARVFGDASDPTTVYAPGGTLSLIALDGDIALSSDSRLSVGGGQGQAGTLSLAAAKGRIYAHDGSRPVSLATTFDASAPGGGGSIALVTGGSFDLSALVSGPGAAFNGAIAIRSGQGDLSLAAGQTLTAASVNLTADGGSVLDAGTLDTSGVNGGAVALYGADGVHLLSTAVIDAQANGYGATDTRQASGGDVTLGVAGSGAIAVDAGAVIDVSALHTANRLVPLDRTDGSYGTYVAGDVGGTLTLSAPVVTTSGGVETVNVGFQGAVKGASGVVLEGYKDFDLATLAANPDYTGVTISNGRAILDTSASGAGLINPLTDNASGTLVNFIQGYDVSADYGALGGLAGQANFASRPGVNLTYSGDIVLQSNWNLGAGTVNVAGAVAAGLMVPIAQIPGQYAVVAGDEGEIFANYTTLTYRVGGSVTGQPGVLSLQAGGSLTLNGSLTDGFFQFRDQTNPQYLDYALGGGNRSYQGSLTPDCTINCARVAGYDPNLKTYNYVSIDFPYAGGLTSDPYQDPEAPYSALANSPSALGSLPGGAGDAIGSAQLFPLLPGPGGGTATPSWSYNLVAGADLGGAGRPASVDPLATVAGSDAALVVQGQHVYHYQATAGASSFADTLDLQSNGVTYTPAQWLGAFETDNPGLNGNSYTSITYGDAGRAVQASVKALAEQYFAAHPGEAQLTSTAIKTKLSVAAEFMAYVSQHFAEIAPDYRAPGEEAARSPTYAVAPTLVRTGTGDINLAASGDINLQNGATPVMLNRQGKLVPVTGGGIQLGGAAIYTAGHIAQLGVTTAVDEATGKTVTIDLGANADTTDVFSTDPQDGYTYGAGNFETATGYTGILIADPVYAEGGGGVSLKAGRDVLGRRDTFQEQRLGGVGAPALASQPFSWIGSGDQPWRTGSIANLVNVEVDPQLFEEGVGTLGGGAVSVQAGRNVSDLSVVATDSITTASVTNPGAAHANGAALVTLGGGNVAIGAGGDLLGGRLDVASGQAQVSVGGAIASAGQIIENFGAAPVSNLLRVRLSDATIGFSVLGDVTLQGITALGVSGGASTLNSKGFYAADAGVSILADGPVTIANTGADVVIAKGSSTDYTSSAVYPGSLSAVSLTGDLDISTPGGSAGPSEALLYPSPTGTLTLIAAGDIAPTTIAMLDSDPTLLPGAFSSFTADAQLGVTSGQAFAFPAVLPNTSDVELGLLHNPDPTHTGDSMPNRIAAGGDIDDVILSTPKATRVSAGRDIVNMVFLGQNLAPGDITRITAGRDIIGTSTLANALVSVGPPEQFGPLLPAVQGNTFVIGGPGAFFLEAGRDLGPFLNSADTDGFAATGAGNVTATGTLSYAGGVIAVGNLWNPALPQQSADIFTAFGVAKGQDYAALIADYLAPSAFASQPDYLFEQVTGGGGVQTADRSQQIYALSLTDWFKSIAPQIISSYDTSAGVSAPGASAPAVVKFAEKLQSGATVSFAQALAMLPQVADDRLPLIPWLQLNESAALTKAYGTLDVTYQQAFDLFSALPTLTQREFLLKDVYFNELISTSIPTGPSYLKYSRGYTAVNTLFPGSDGYTQNSLSGGPAGASTTVQTGNLDLRLATIETEQGGDITLLGPGGEVLAGSTVATAAQAARRVYIGGQLYAGGGTDVPLPAAITQIPVGYEGVITLQGGSLDSFTDGDFLLNQSRAFTEAGGDIAIWSSNANVNAGQGPKTSADFPPVVVRIDENGFSDVNQAGSVSGAGIAAFQPDPKAAAPDVFLLAPRGTVDAGDAGVRSAGDVFIAAFAVANANDIQASGTVSGVPTSAAVNVGVQTSASAATAAAAQAAQAATATSDTGDHPLITVDVLGHIDDDTSDDEEKRSRSKRDQK